MKNKLTQFLSFVNKVDNRYLQFTYFVLMLAIGIVIQSPSDGGTGPF